MLPRASKQFAGPAAAVESSLVPVILVPFAYFCLTPQCARGSYRRACHTGAVMPLRDMQKIVYKSQSQIPFREVS